MSSRHGLSIRAADSGDLDGLVALFRTAGVPAPAAGLAARLQAMQVEPGVLLIAEEWGPPSGLIAVHWHTALATELKAGWISALLVHPERRRNGVARVLLKAAAQAARTAGCGELTLAAAAGAEGLEAFCLATGFAPAGDLFTRPLRKRG